MGIKKSQTRWSEEEILYLKNNWGNMGGAVCNKLTSHTVSAVRQKAKELGLRRKNGKNSYWSNKEIAFLEDNAGSLSAKEIAQALNRPESSVFWKLSAEKIKKRCG